MGNGNANNCTASVCGNAISQPGAESMSGSAIVNVTSDVFANDSLTHELRHHHHHLALQPFVGFGLLSQVSPSFSILSCFLPVSYFRLI